MWFKEYRDYPIDHPLIKEQVESGKGIIGCEMHDLNGWGTELHLQKRFKKKKINLFSLKFFQGKAWVRRRNAGFIHGVCFYIIFNASVWLHYRRQK